MKQNSIMQASALSADATVAPTVAAPPVAPAAATISTAPAALSAVPAATHAVAQAATHSATHSAPSALTDAQLYRQCKHYGKQAKDWMRKFESLLPEVYRRRLYKRRGFAGIHEFAQKLAGMSKEKVDRILQLSRKLEDKPALRAVFERGDVGYSKIVKVVYCANEENDREWADKVATYSRSRLESAIREERSDREETVPGNSLQPEKMTDHDMAFYESTFGCALTGVLTNKVSFNMRPETERKLRSLQSELGKAHGEAISLGETIEILINREHEELIEKARKKKTANYCPDCVKKRADEAARKSETARAVPAEIRHTVLARQNYLCAGDESNAKCTHPPAELHHLDGWALTKNHNPDRMRYLCKKHHTEVHTGDPHVQAYRSW